MKTKNVAPDPAISDDARNEQIYRLIAIELLDDALRRLRWYQEKFNLPIETAKGVIAATVINFYESESAN